LVFFGGGGRGGGGGGVRLFGWRGAIRFSILLEDFANGECTERDVANGEPGLELARRISSDIDPEVFGMTELALDDINAADDGNVLGVVG
jgi:hypothetical protein